MARPQIDKNKRRKSCNFCADKVEVIDYKDAQNQKIFNRSRKNSSKKNYRYLCRTQRMLARAVKKAREAALINYVYD